MRESQSFCRDGTAGRARETAGTTLRTRDEDRHAGRLLEVFAEAMPEFAAQSTRAGGEAQQRRAQFERADQRAGDEDRGSDQRQSARFDTLRRTDRGEPTVGEGVDRQRRRLRREDRGVSREEFPAVDANGRGREETG